MIKINNLTKIFKISETRAVNNVSLEIKRGEIFGIVGYSGAGKSTMIRLINQLEKQTSGSIIINDIDITNLNGKRLRRQRQKIGMIFQHFNLLSSKTVLENIKLPLEIVGVSKQTREEKALELVKLVGLEGKENAYPSELSGGQKQRVGIARALANDPEILLCDEATSALDPHTTDTILNLLKDINKKFNLTIILITHEMRVIKQICHRVAVMDSGEIVELGNVYEVFSSPSHETTKRFISEANNEVNVNKIFEDIKDYHANGALLHLNFDNSSSNQPILSEAIIKYQIPINIIQGNITLTNNGQIGSLYVEVDTDESLLNQVISYIKEQRVKVEVIKK